MPTQSQETMKELEALVNVEEAVEEDASPLTDAPRKSGMPAGPRIVAMLGLALVGAVIFSSTTASARPQKGTFYKKLHRNAAIIKLVQQPPPASLVQSPEATSLAPPPPVAQGKPAPKGVKGNSAPKPPPKGVKGPVSVSTAMSEINQAEQESYAVEEFEDIGDDIVEDGDKFPAPGPLKEVKDLGVSFDDLDQMQKMFEMVDANSNGFITQEELADLMERMEPETTTEEEKETFDQAGPERQDPVDAIDWKEFVNFQVETMEQEGDMDETPNDVGDEVANAADFLKEVDQEENGIPADGKISQAEFTKFVSLAMQHGQGSAEEMTKMIFAMFDYDHDGYLNGAETQTMMLATQ